MAIINFYHFLEASGTNSHDFSAEASFFMAVTYFTNEIARDVLSLVRQISMNTFPIGKVIQISTQCNKEMTVVQCA